MELQEKQAKKQNETNNAHTCFHFEFVEYRRELSFHPEINFIFKDANGNTQQQIQQIEELINQNIDLLIVSPMVADPITPVVEKAFQKRYKGDHC